MLLPEDVMPAKDAARLLGVAWRTIYRLAEDHRIRAYGARPLLVSLEEVGAAMRPHVVDAVEEITLATKLSPEARQAYANLHVATVAAVQAGHPPPCVTTPGDLWLSDSAADRAQATVLCGGCAAFAACASYADLANERFGCWAGVDRGAARTNDSEEVA